VVGRGGGATIAEARNDADSRLRVAARRNPLVGAVLDAFPEAEITDIRPLDDGETGAEIETLDAPDDDWDPFEQD